MSRSRVVPSALALAAVALLAAGCSTGPASPAPTSTAPTGTATGAPDASTPPSDAPVGPMPDDVEAAWLDGGRSFALVTWGSSSGDCRPATAEATADGQTVSVVLSDPVRDSADRACDSDLGPRAIFVETPAGVDVTQDVEVEVVYGDIRDDADLEALPGPARAETDYQPSAGWFDDDGIVLLTWGSSSCLPQVENVEQTDAGATVTFAEIDGVCTMDMAARLTVISLTDERADDDAPFALTLTGGGLDGTVDLIGRD